MANGGAQKIQSAELRRKAVVIERLDLGIEHLPGNLGFAPRWFEQDFPQGRTKQFTRSRSNVRNDRKLIDMFRRTRSRAYCHSRQRIGINARRVVHAFGATSVAIFAGVGVLTEQGTLHLFFVMKVDAKDFLVKRTHGIHIERAEVNAQFVGFLNHRSSKIERNARNAPKNPRIEFVCGLSDERFEFG